MLDQAGDHGLLVPGSDDGSINRGQGADRLGPGLGGSGAARAPARRLCSSTVRML
jgi:hypothetical protein